MDKGTYTYGSFSFPACPLKPNVPSEYLINTNNFLATLTDQQLATVANEIYECATGERLVSLAEWLDEITNLSGYHGLYMVQNMVTKEIIRRYINSVEPLDD